MAAAIEDRRFPISAGILFGLGLGGFFDGIVFHQLLQWHHMATSAGYPPDTVENLKFNTLLDGAFHAATYIFVVVGLVVLWRTARRGHLWWSGKLMAGTILMGFGIFNLVDSIIDHHVLGLHHVNETVPREQVDLLGHRFSRLGSRDADRRMAAPQIRQAAFPRRSDAKNRLTQSLPAAPLAPDGDCVYRRHGPTGTRPTRE